MNDRYSRQLLFEPIGNEGQEKIRSKHVLIIGAGALGTANAEAMTRAGIGRLTVIDRDYVEWSNLQRQQLFTEKDAEEKMPKAIALRNHLREINSDVQVEPIMTDVGAQNLLSFVEKGVDVIIDATDNFDTRLVINDVSWKNDIPWVFGACVGSTGMAGAFLPGTTVCFSCLLNKTPMAAATCDTAGIIAPAVQAVVAHQTAETLKILVEDNQSMHHSLVTFDLWNHQYHKMKLTTSKQADCHTCGTVPSYPNLQYENQLKTAVLCGRNTVQIREQSKKFNFEKAYQNFTRIGDPKKNPYLISVEYESFRVVLFKDGRALIHGTDDPAVAKRVYHQLIG